MKLKYGAHLHIPLPHPHPLLLVSLKEHSTLDSLGAFILKLLSSIILCLVLNKLLHVATPLRQSSHSVINTSKCIEVFTVHIPIYPLIFESMNALLFFLLTHLLIFDLQKRIHLFV